MIAYVSTSGKYLARTAARVVEDWPVPNRATASAEVPTTIRLRSSR